MKEDRPLVSSIWPAVLGGAIVWGLLLGLWLFGALLWGGR